MNILKIVLLVVWSAVGYLLATLLLTVVIAVLGYGSFNWVLDGVPHEFHLVTRR